MANISINRVFFNPGFAFVIIFLVTGIVIVTHESSDKVSNIKTVHKNTLGSRSDVAYSNDSNWGSILSVSETGEDNIYSADKMKEDSRNHSTKTCFNDVTLESGIDFFHTQGGKKLNAISEVIGSGACMFDYDNDGFVDLYAVNGAGYTHYYGKKWWWNKDSHNTLYHNNGDGTFTDVTEKAGVGDKGWGMGCASGDYDNDGNPDLYVTNYGANVLYHNNGDGTFTDVTGAAGVGDEGWGTSIVWGDYNNDGNLDMYFANYLIFDKTMNPGEPNSAFKIDMPLLMDSKLFEGQKNVLYRNNGDGTFTDVTDKAGVGNSPGKSMGVVFCDINDDGYQDIYIVNDNSRNVLYLNNGNESFTDLGGVLGMDSPLSGMGVTIGDYDNDGDMDIFSTYTQKDTNILYKNTISNNLEPTKAVTHSKFINATMNAGLGEDVSVGYFGWGTEFLDYDNDGFLDLFVANGHGMPDFDNPRSTIGQRNQLFRNNGEGVFIDVSDTAGYGLRLKNSSRGVSIGDYDNDGDIDVFILNNNAYSSLLENTGGNANNWLNIKLTGTRSNRDAIGAKVKVTAGTSCQTKEVRSGSGFLSQSDIRLNFGLGAMDKIDIVEIKWPSGRMESFRDVAVNQFVTIVEGERKFNVVNTVKMASGERLIGSENVTKDTTGVKDSVVSQQVLKALGEIGDERAIKPLLRCLRDEDPGIRREAVKALRYFDSDRAIEPIISALEDSNVEVRGEAAGTLGYLLKTEQTIRKASIQRKRLGVPPLLRALEDEDQVVRQEAVEALGFSESYRVCIPVTKMLGDTVKEVRLDAALTLGLLRDKRAVEPLIKILDNFNEDASTKANALISLNRLDSNITIEPLLKALKDKDCKIRLNAVSVFVSLFENDEGVVFKKKQAIGPLLEALNDENPSVRRELVKALGLIKDKQVNDHLISTLADKDKRVKLMAIKVLSSNGIVEALPYIEQSTQDEDNEVRKEAIVAFSVLKGSESIPYLVNMLTVSNIEVKKQAIISLGTFKDRNTVDVLIGVIRDVNEDKHVRLYAISSLVKINKDPGIFIDSLDDSNYEIRKEASRCLGFLKDKRAIEPLIKKVQDGNVEVRREAVLALGYFKGSRVFNTLVRVLQNRDEDDIVRSGSVLSLSQLGNRKVLLQLLNVLKNRGDKVRPEVVKALGGFSDELSVKQLMMTIENRGEDSILRSEAVIAMTQIQSEKVVDNLLSLIQPNCY